MARTTFNTLLDGFLLPEDLVILVEGLLGELDLVLLVVCHLFLDIFYFRSRIGVKSEEKLSEEVGVGDLNSQRLYQMLRHRLIELIKEL